MKTRTLFIFLMIALIAILVVSCGGAKETPTPEPPPPTNTPVPPTDTPVPPTDTPVPPTDTPVPPTPTPEPEPEVSSAVNEAAVAYFSGGPRTITQEALFENLNDGDEDNDPYIISVRAPDDYAAGHIPGAVNISVKELFDPDVLATIPTDKDIVVTCYTGQTAAQATAALNLAGYNASSLLFGMSSWTNDPAVFVKRFNPEKHAHPYPATTDASDWSGETYDLAQALADDPAAAAYAYLQNGPKTIVADALFENLNDGDEDNDPFIISVRSEDDYSNAGHIAGALWVSPKELFTPENLAKLPTDQPIVVYCYTGQTAGQVTSALNILGYDASSVLFGMSGWSDDPAVFVKRFNPEKHTKDYPTEAGAGEMSAAGANAVYDGVQTAMADGPDYIQADALFENLNDGDEENDPYIISVRAPDDYAAGHIPGAVNLSVKDLFNPDVISTIPTDKEIVMVCYTGQTASQATGALESAGYDAKALLFGMSSWTTDPAVFVKRFDPEKAAHDYPTSTEADEWGDETYDLPAPPASEPVAAADAWLDDGANFITADVVFENLNDGDEDNDPIIISVRSQDDYNKGHISGAVWASPTELFSAEMLSKLDPEREIVVACYTGQTASQVTAGLNNLGYHAKALLHGMSSWTTNPDVFVKRFNPEKHAHDYMTESGS